MSGEMIAIIICGVAIAAILVIMILQAIGKLN